jgi:uncharacterized protein YjlB
MTMIQPEQYFLRPTPHVPNSRLPFLVYRGALKGKSTAEMKKHIEANKWLKGGQWKTYKIAHFHTNTHECYAVLSGETLYQVGKSPIDDEFDADGKKAGVRVWLAQGDVFVLPVCLLKLDILIVQAENIRLGLAILRWSPRGIMSIWASIRR